MTHEIDYQIHGASLQYVEITLDEDETVVAEAGHLLYMEDGIRFETRMGDGSSAGVMGKMFGATKRMLTGESLFMTRFTNHSDEPRRVAFAAPHPGEIRPLRLAQHGGEIICQKDCFLAAAKGVSIGIHFQRKILTALFGQPAVPLPGPAVCGPDPTATDTLDCSTAYSSRLLCSTSARISNSSTALPRNTSKDSR